MKLGFIVAIGTLCFANAASALQALDDDSLSLTSGQDGIDLTITPPTTGLKINKIEWYDKDGLTGIAGQTAVSGGVIEIGGNTSDFVIDTAGNPIVLKIDADGGASSTNATLNINLKLPSTLKVTTGDFVVIGSNRNTVGTSTTTPTTWGVKTSGHSTVLNSMTIDLSGANVNLQLGKQPQGSLVKLSGDLATGLNIANFEVRDAVNGGGIKLGAIKVTNDQEETKLTLVETIKLTNAGLELTRPVGPWINIAVENIRVGNTSLATSSIGDARVVGLNLTGTSIAITGH